MAEPANDVMSELAARVKAGGVSGIGDAASRPDARGARSGGGVRLRGRGVRAAFASGDLVRRRLL